MSPASKGYPSPEMLLLQTQLADLQDSITAVQLRLMRILENKSETKVDHELATQLLADIHRSEVLEYLFEHEPELQFGLFGSEQREEDEVHRTAIKAIRRAYGESRNWMVFPYLFQHLPSLSYSELGMIQAWLLYPTEYKAPWALLEFMEANADPQSKTVIQYMLANFNQFKRPGGSKN